MQNGVRVLCCLALLCALLGSSPNASAQKRENATGTPMTKEQAVALYNRLFKPAFDKVKAGDALYKQGDLDGAIREYQSSLWLLDNSGTHARIAKPLSAKGRDTEALQQYRVAIADTPLPDVDIALNMALHLAKMKRYDEAITLYRVGMRLPIHPARATGALSGTPVTPNYDAFRSRIAAREETGELSLFDLRFTPNAFATGLFEAAARTGLGKYRYGWPDAIEEFDRAIQLAPTFAPAYLYRGDALKSSDRYAEARLMYQKAAALGVGEVKVRAEQALQRMQ